MHGIGNDFILINNIKYGIDEKHFPQLARIVCDRHFSIGADGILLINYSNTHDIKMRIFNSDGSEAEMCGNGIRCFAKYAYENEIIKSLEFKVETLAGTIIPRIILENSQVKLIEVDMGKPKLKRSEIPMTGNPDDIVISEKKKFDFLEYEITCVNMGNPHCIIYVDNVDSIDLFESKIIENSSDIFPEKINVEYVEIISDSQQKVRVWERGAGITLACGTGACATVVSSVLNKKLEKNKEILVNLPGGDLLITWADNDHVYMKGPAEISFRGFIDVNL